jgi:hypothetical protein
MLVKAGADVNYKNPTVLTASHTSRLPIVAACFASQCLMVTLLQDTTYIYVRAVFDIGWLHCAYVGFG